MERQVELYRRILIEMEKSNGPHCDLRDLEGFSHKIFAYHVGLLHQAGFIKAIELTSHDGVDWMPLSITHEGHEFLDAVKEEAIWGKTKKLAKSASGTLTVETLKAALPVVLKSFFN